MKLFSCSRRLCRALGCLKVRNFHKIIAINKPHFYAKNVSGLCELNNHNFLHKSVANKLYIVGQIGAPCVAHMSDPAGDTRTKFFQIFFYFTKFF